MGEPITMAAGAAMGSMALSAGGKVVKGVGEYEAAQFAADRDERAAEFGRIKADQTDVQLREQLTTTLGNISTIRAAGNIDPLSPTTAAINTEETRVADRERNIRVGNLRMQAREDDLAAKQRRRGAIYGAVGTALGAGGDVAAGISKMPKG